MPVQLQGFRSWGFQSDNLERGSSYMAFLKASRAVTVKVSKNSISKGISNLKNSSQDWILMPYFRTPIANLQANRDTPIQKLRLKAQKKGKQRSVPSSANDPVGRKRNPDAKARKGSSSRYPTNLTIFCCRQP